MFVENPGLQLVLSLSAGVLVAAAAHLAVSLSQRIRLRRKRARIMRAMLESPRDRARVDGLRGPHAAS